MELYNSTPPDTPDVSHIGAVGWAALCAGVVIFDLLANETLSHACQRGLENKYARPFILGAICLTGGHLAGIIPVQYDPLKSLARIPKQRTPEGAL